MTENSAEKVMADRMTRIRLLQHRYIIRIQSERTGKYLYLQDRDVSQTGYWTEFLSNAVGFHKSAVALDQLKHLHHNNPTICYVDALGNVVPMMGKEDPR